MSTLYAEHFHLKEAPFSIAPNPRFLFMSGQHREALAHLLYGIGHDGGFVLLTGEVGTGKTTLCRCLLEKVPDDTDVAFIINPRLSVVDLLANICDELGIAYAADRLNNRLLVDAINQYLLERHAGGRKTVLIIDEAQNLDSDVLEQLRLLTNLETDERKLLQIILLGQPELQEKLSRSDLRQLSQRITARYHLTALDRNDMRAYITHRLAVAGCEQAVFSPAALGFIHRQSQGIPRLINLICDRAMLGAFAAGVSRINRAMTRQAAREVLGEQEHARGSRWRPALTWSAFGLLLLGAAIWSADYRTAPQTTGIASSPTAPSPTAVSAPMATSKAQAVPVEVRRKETPATEASPPLPEAPVEASRRAADISDAAAAATPTDNPPAPTTPAAPAAGAGLMQDRQTAFRALFAAWGIALPDDADPCSFAASSGLACMQQAGDLGRLRSLDRPAVIEWQNDAGNIGYITIIALSGSTARAIMGEQSIELPLEQLQQHWLDRFTLLWRTPDAYQSDILPGTVGPSAKWLNERLAALDAHPAAGSKVAHIPGIYQGEWVLRLRRFQRDAGLLPDGVAGPQTLIQLNAQLHAAGPRLMTASGKVPAPGPQQAANH